MCAFDDCIAIDVEYFLDIKFIFPQYVLLPLLSTPLFEVASTVGVMVALDIIELLMRNSDIYNFGEEMNTILQLSKC